MTLTLARVQDSTGGITPVPTTSLTLFSIAKINYFQNDFTPLGVCACLPLQGSRGLSLFYAEVKRNEEGQLKGIEVQRLKDKLGTRQMPTAELLLDGLPAHRVSHTIINTYCNDKSQILYAAPLIRIITVINETVHTGFSLFR